jgi:hypothetical protein
MAGLTFRESGNWTGIHSSTCATSPPISSQASLPRSRGQRRSRNRQILLDDRALPTDPNPTWLGYSVGRWEQDVLIVETAGFNGKTWLDLAGHPSTDALHVTERFRRRDFGHLELQLTIDDPKAYTKPWTVTQTMQLAADTELLEYVCNENEKDLQHLVGR